MTIKTESRFTVEFKPDSFVEVPMSGSIWGDVYFRCGDQTWPGPTWDDFILGLATTWRSDVQNLVGGKPASLWFEDGPYGIDIVPVEKDECLIRAWDRGYGKGPNRNTPRYKYHWECRESLPDVIAELIRFAEGFFAVCRAKGWTNNLRPFERAYRNLRFPDRLKKW